MYNGAVTMTAKKRALLLEKFEEKAAEAAGFHAVQGASWGRRLERARRLNVRYLAYLFRRFVIPGSAKARVFWGKRYRWGRPEHSTSMYLYGVLEHAEEVRLTRFFIRTLQSEDVFLDIGANFGFYSLLASEILEEGRVIAFEPVSFVFRGLNASAARTTNVEAVNSAVSDRVGTLEFDQAPESRHTGSSFNEAEARVEGAPVFAFTRVKVASTTVDAYCAERKIVPTVIKIDVEGAEKLVIDGGLRTLAAGTPTIVLEVWKPPQKNENHRDAAAVLKKLGYEVHALTDDGGLKKLDDAELEAEFSGGEAANLVFKKPRRENAK